MAFKATGLFFANSNHHCEHDYDLLSFNSLLFQKDTQQCSGKQLFLRLAVGRETAADTKKKNITKCLCFLMFENSKL